ncbi:MAG: hypothetical protein GEU90_08165 [Gemmatimonas sp.]|nr:hypothetical protein [Gemmatimonas sp.]
MRLVLSLSEQTRLTATARTLLSPFDAPIDQWRADVLDHLTILLGAEAGGFMLPVGEAPPYTLRQLPDEFGQEYIETYLAIDESLPMIQSVPDGVWSTRLLLQGADPPTSLERSLVYQEFYGKYRVWDAIGFAVMPTAGTPSPTAEPSPGALLTCFHERFGTDGFGERGLAMLRLLAPALEAGIGGRLRHRWSRGVLEVGFDASRDGLLMCNREGRRLFANAALLEILRMDPKATRITAAIERVKAVCTTLVRRARDAPPPDLAAAAEIRTARARYRIQGNIAGGEASEPGSTILVSVQRLTPQLPTPEQLQERWGFTGQESRVALLLAQGMTNGKIAEALGLKSSTIRHYTESVFSKLRVHSRAEAAYKVLCH